MKKYLASLLGLLSLATPAAFAYRLDINSPENITNEAQLIEKLEKYEAAALSKLASVIKDAKIDPLSAISLSLSLDGSIHTFTYKNPAPEEVASRKALQEARNLNFGKIPGLQRGLLKLSLTFQELCQGDFKRKLYVVITPNGQSVGGSGGINIGGILNASETPGISRAPRPFPLLRSNCKAAVAVPYSDKDRKFDQEINSIYSSISARPSNNDFNSETSSVTRAEQEKLTAQFIEQKQWLAACTSYLKEAQFFLRLSDLDNGKERIAKAKELVSKLQPMEKESFIKSLTSTAKILARSRESYACREYLLVEANNLTKTQKNIDDSLRLVVLQELADFYQSGDDKANALTNYKEMLTTALRSKSTKKAADAYVKLATTQIALNDKVLGNKTLLEATRYIEKEAGKDSLLLIPILVSKIQNSSDSKENNILVDRLNSIVNNYNNPNISDGRMQLDKDALTASSLLMNSMRRNEYRRNSNNLPALDTEVGVALSQIGFKLKLKSEPRFDNSAFYSLVNTMQEAGKYEQTANLYKETISMLERSSDKFESRFAEGLRQGYVSALERIGKTEFVEKEKIKVKAAEDERIAQSIRYSEERVARMMKDENQDSADRIKLRANLFAQYANQKNSTKVKEQLENILQDLNTIKSPSSKLSSCGFPLIGSLRTQSELFNSDNTLATLITKVILALDEKTANGLDPMAINTLNMNMRRDKNELTQNIANALAEAHKARPITASEDSTFLKVKIRKAQAQGDRTEEINQQKQLVDCLKSSQKKDELISQTVNLSRLYSLANQQTEAKSTFEDALKLVSDSTEREKAQSIDIICHACAIFLARQNYELTELGMRKCIDLATSMPDAAPDYRAVVLESSLLNLGRSYEQSGEFDKEIAFQKYVQEKYNASKFKNSGFASRNLMCLSQAQLLAAKKNPEQKEQLMRESKSNFNQALAGMRSSYGPKHNYCKNAIKMRLQELPGNDLKAIEEVQNLQDID